MKSRPTQRCIALAALLAMLAVQLSGGLFHFFCDCTGTPVFTLEEHCHEGFKGQAASDENEPLNHRHHDEQDEHPADDDDHHHHELVKTPTDSVPPAVAAAPMLCAPVVFLIEIPEIITVPTMELRLVSLRPPDTGGHLPPPVMVVRSVVFLI